MASKGVNKVILIGNVCKDPEVRATAGGECIVNFTIATSESWKDKQTGAKQERTEFHRVSAFGRLAEIIRDYVVKGSKVYAEGALRTRSYDKEGVKVYVTEIVANDLQMLDSRGQAPQQAAPAPQQHEVPPSFDDDIPF